MSRRKHGGRSSADGPACHWTAFLEGQGKNGCVTTDENEQGGISGNHQLKPALLSYANTAHVLERDASCESVLHDQRPKVADTEGQSQTKMRHGRMRSEDGPCRVWISESLRPSIVSATVVGGTQALRKV